MTILMRQTEDVQQEIRMPGWDIVADLTPPELLVQRSLAVLRRRILLGLVTLLVLCAGAYALAVLRSGAADDDASVADLQSAQLNRAVHEYSGITRLEETVAAIDTQQANVFKQDVDVAKLLGRIRLALPASMKIQSLSVTITPAATTGTTTGESATGDAATGLDTSGHRTVGTVSISGSGAGLDDLPLFVDRLTTVRGLANVIPTTNQVSKKSSQFSVTLDLTDVVFTHHFDVKAGSAR